MEQNFQTSFIPKKPMIEKPSVSSRPASFLIIISIFIFFTMVLISGGLYFYNNIVIKDIEKMKNDLGLAKNDFEPSKIVQLQVLDKRLSASSEILSRHIAISPIFKSLEDITMKTIRYTKFSYDLGAEKGAKVSVKMSGQALGYSSTAQAVGYTAIALQSDLFTKNKYFIDPVFSNLSLDEKSGNVLFDLEFLVDPSFIDYKQNLEKENSFTNNEEDIN